MAGKPKAQAPDGPMFAGVAENKLCEVMDSGKGDGSVTVEPRGDAKPDDTTVILTS